MKTNITRSSLRLQDTRCNNPRACRLAESRPDEKSIIVGFVHARVINFFCPEKLNCRNTTCDSLSEHTNIKNLVTTLHPLSLLPFGAFSLLYSGLTFISSFADRRRYRARIARSYVVIAYTWRYVDSNCHVKATKKYAQQPWCCFVRPFYLPRINEARQRRNKQKRKPTGKRLPYIRRQIVFSFL